MPELPEVESLRRGLLDANLVQPVRGFWRSDLRLRTGEHWRDENLHHLEGATSVDFVRKGKHLVWELRARKQRIGLLIHLGMSGRVLIQGASEPRAPHTHFVAKLADARELRFVDPRRFGGLKAAPWDVLWREPPLSLLGLDALDPAFCGTYLQSSAGTSARGLRDVLLDQSVVAGIGNIYALEALFRARLHPLLAARRLRASAWDRLAVATREVLDQGLRNGGTTFRDYRDAHGEKGRNVAELAVYGRAGLPCLRCGEALQSAVIGGRGAVFCARDQPRPRSRSVT